MSEKLDNQSALRRCTILDFGEQLGCPHLAQYFALETELTVDQAFEALASAAEECAQRRRLHETTVEVVNLYESGKVGLPYKWPLLPGELLPNDFIVVGLDGRKSEPHRVVLASTLRRAGD